MLRPNPRIAVPAGFLVIAAGVIWSAFIVQEPTRQSLLINLGTEIVGIILTVAVVEYFFERRRNLERGRQVAWSALHAVEHAVWVWQGGPRSIESDQLLGILGAVTDDSPLPDFTQNLLLGLGTRAKQALHNEQRALASMPHLTMAYEELSRLDAIREGGRVKPSKRVAEILELATQQLARTLQLSDEPMPARLIRYVDASAEAQELRYFGGTVDGGSGTPAPPRRISDSGGLFS